MSTLSDRQTLNYYFDLDCAILISMTCVYWCFIISYFLYPCTIYLRETAYQLQNLGYIQHYKDITHRCYMNAKHHELGHYRFIFSWDCRRRQASWWPEQACPDRTNELQQKTNEACSEEPSEFAPRPPHHVILKYLLACTAQSITKLTGHCYLPQ